MTDYEKLTDMIGEINSKMQNLELSMQAQAATSHEMLRMYESVKGFFVVLAWVERASIWIGKLSLAAGILWYIFKESVIHALKDGGK